MLRANIIILTAIAAVTFSLWAYLNQPEQEPAWPDRIQGFSFSPAQEDDNPIEHILPSAAEIDADLALLSGKTFAVRTYTIEGTLAQVPELARKYNINICLGAWIGDDLEKNQAEIDKLIEVANANYNVVRIIVGNEVLLRNDIPVEQLIQYLDEVRAAVRVPVSTAEPWHVWIKHPEVAEHVDFIGTHMLPYWEGISVDTAVDYVVDRTNELRTRFPNLPVVISEVGWPSNGRPRKAAVASESNEAIFLRRFLARAKVENYTYYIMEAFDQPWKSTNEGSVGAYWGVYDVHRHPKFEFKEPIVKIPEWHMLAGISGLLAVLASYILLIDSRTLRKRGRGFLAVLAYGAATGAVWAIYDFVNQYMTMTSVLVGISLVIGMIGVILVMLTEGHEWAEALWVTGRRRSFTPRPFAAESAPKVSIHIPCYNEPPDMVIQTLNALNRLDYPDFEVLVIDNNTKDPAVWQPVEAHCQRLGTRFRFFHVDPLSGFKAGALNYAIKETAPDAAIIAVIDSDYLVDQSWLKDLVPQFAEPRVGVVQAPQDYRDGCQNAFKALCYAEYKGFFQIGMITRNERNAIIQHGTMTMIRKSVMTEVGGWSEWCITEDADLGLSIIEHGHDAIYNPKSYGQGLIPDTFNDFKKQRFRWAYGAVQILRHHAGTLLGKKKTGLHAGQRYHFLAGWLPWLTDGMNLLFTVLALGWSAAMIIAPKVIDPPLLVFSILPLSLFCFKASKMVYLYRAKVGASTRETMAAALAGLSLSYTISKAVLQGLVTTDKPFFRTPKMANASALLKALASAWEEALFLAALLTAAVAVSSLPNSDNVDLLGWTLVLIVQAVPYLASCVVSFISAFPAMPARYISGICREKATHALALAHGPGKTPS